MIKEFMVETSAVEKFGLKASAQMTFKVISKIVILHLAIWHICDLVNFIIQEFIFHKLAQLSILSISQLIGKFQGLSFSNPNISSEDIYAMNSLPINVSTSGVVKITVKKYGDEKSGVEPWF